MVALVVLVLVSAVLQALMMQEGGRGVDRVYNGEFRYFLRRTRPNRAMGCGFVRRHGGAMRPTLSFDTASRSF